MRRLMVLVAAGVLGSTAIGMTSGPPAQARVCASASASVGGTGTSQGGCQPLLDEWISPCFGAGAFEAGTRAEAGTCLPSPV